MAEITASMVKELREKTDAPMMECKKALTEAGGDLAKAEEILRVKLGSKASKAAARVAAEGVVAVHIDGQASARSSRSTRNRLRRQERRLPQVRAAILRRWSRRAIRPMSLRCPRFRSAAERSRRSAQRWSARSARTCRSAASRASRRRARWRAMCTAAARSACWSTSAAPTASWPRTWRCILPPASRSHSMPSEVAAELSMPSAASRSRRRARPASREAMLEKIAEGTVQKFLKEVTLLGQASSRPRTASRPSSSC